MGRILWKKGQEALISVLPVSLIVCLLNFTPLLNLSGKEITVFLICTLFLIIGIALFNLGADLAMSPMGEHVGAGLTKANKLLLLLGACFAMGLLITVAEPDLSVLASQVSNVMNGTLLIFTVGIGVGIFLLISVLKIVFRLHLSSLLLFFYFAMFAVASLLILAGRTEFLALSFDSGGVTTGPITVPFLMALGVGIASTVGGKNMEENSFGMIALCSIGPILAVLILGLFANGSLSYQLPDYSIESQLGAALPKTILDMFEEVALALGMIVAFFLILQILVLKLPRKKIYQIAIGILYTFFGLVIFLSAVTVGFMPIGFQLGGQLAQKPFLLILFGFVIGAVVVLAEPAVHVLNKQVEEVTDRAVSRRSMMIALCAGVGISIGLSMLRIWLGFNILYYLIPGYFLSLGLSFFVPGLYTAIAFDSGGVASGPLTSSFILPFAIGACAQMGGNIMTDAFGIVAMVAMTPLITIQTLGFKAIVTRKVQKRIAMRRILNADDEEIIYFN